MLKTIENEDSIKKAKCNVNINVIKYHYFHYTISTIIGNWN